MRWPRFRLRSLMILVLVSALGLGAFIPLSRIDLSQIHDWKPRIFLVGSFLILVVAKFGLFIGLRANRYRAEHPGELPGPKGSNGEMSS